ncbi:DMP19 family protein [Mycoplasma sp. P36-A1]|uniref:DMP19 family protein n=1 Tax=Mycoplasma sp. P36-A1 TaxID=3252900 RepID=UPI003C2BBDDE
MEKIVLSINVKEPTELFDVVVSNEEFIKKAFASYMLPQDINQDSLAIYYLDQFDEIVSINGFKAFFFKTRNSKTIKNMVNKAMQKLQLDEHLQIYEKYLDRIKIYDNEDIYDLEGKMDVSFHDLDLEYRDLDEENLENVNASFLLNHIDTVFFNDAEQDKYITDYVKTIKTADMKERRMEKLDSLPSYLKHITLICSAMNKQLAQVNDAYFKMFDFNNRLIISFSTTDKKDYSYIDLGQELVLCNRYDEEIRRYSKKGLGDSYE